MGKLVRVGTIYIPVLDVKKSVNWYVENLDAILTYEDEDKGIINLANVSVFLVKALENQVNSFQDVNDNMCFPVTFEVDGLNNLLILHQEFVQKGIKVGEIEDRGHAGNNFIFYDLDNNMFDVWSELSPSFKQSLK
ncbi:VOC family protein [Bacillus sp. Bva_UNVM-123]|uniref:VOC family protein n=1 Tax=Bacillus sp. Bva_UNVM-123 TaxID=2829798 RepID=UPI00391F1C55